MENPPRNLGKDVKHEEGEWRGHDRRAPVVASNFSSVFYHSFSLSLWELLTVYHHEVVGKNFFQITTRKLFTLILSLVLDLESVTDILKNTTCYRHELILKWNPKKEQDIKTRNLGPIIPKLRVNRSSPKNKTRFSITTPCLLRPNFFFSLDEKRLLDTPGCPLKH